MHRHQVVTAGLLAAFVIGSAPLVAHAQPEGAGSALMREQASKSQSLEPSLAAQLESGSLGATGSFGAADGAQQYDPDDVVTLIVQLEDGSGSDGDLLSPAGADDRSLFGLMPSRRDQVKSRIAGILGVSNPMGLGSGGLKVEHDYYHVMQGFAVRVPYKYLDMVRGIDGVKAAFPEHTYSVPTDQGTGDAPDAGSSDGAAPAADSGNTDQYMNGNSLAMVGAGANGLSGKRTVTAVIDSGLDVNHEAFSGTLDASSLDLTAEEVEAAKADADFKASTATHVSDKIPFAYDYADNDDDVVPHASGLEHGTHVAGIIGANGGEKIRGVSPDTQLVAMKVASDATGALYDSAIIAALDDATALGVDSINMSLGTDAGFPDDDNDTYNDIYNAVRAAGIQLNVAAGNSINAAQGNKSGQNLPYATDPDYSIISSPATYNASLAVASVDALDRGMYLKTADGQQFPYKASSADSATLESLNATLEVVDAGYGHADEIPDEVAGNVALIQRGSSDPDEQFAFADKVKNAADKGAVAVIVYNNVDEDALQTMSVDDTRVPSVFVSKAAGEAIKESGSITVSPDFSNPATKMTMSDFSSWGVSPNLELKPEITAPGGQIYSSVLNDSYEYMSGTSMATPQVSGLAASMYQYLEQKYPDKSKTEVYNLSESLLMSTATPVPDGDDSYVSPRKQGAGEANLKAASSSPAYLSVSGADANKPKADLGDSADGTFSFTMTVHNLSDQELTYTLDAAALGENVKDGFLQGTSANFAGKGVDVTYSTGSSVTVSANGTADVTVTITAGDAFKSYAQAAPNGTFLDGFVTLKAADGGVDLSVPYLGFYGDWEKVPVFDAAAGSGEGAHMFQTIVGSPDSSAMLGANVLDGDADAAKVNNPARFALSPNSMGDYFRRFTTNTGLLRNVGRLDFVVTPKGHDDQVLRQYIYDDVAKSYYVASAQAVSYGEAFLKDKPIFDTKDGQGNQLADGWYTFSEHAYVMDADDSENKTVDDTYSFDFYVDSTEPEIRSVKVEGEGADKKIVVTVADAHYVSAVELTSYDGTGSLGKLFEGGEATQTTDEAGNHVYEFEFSYDEVKATADAAGLPMSSINVAAYDYALNQASQQKVLEKAYPTSISIDQATSGDADYDGVYDQTLTVGQDLDLTVTFDPDYTTQRDVTWTTDDDAKVKVDDRGVVTATGATAEGAPAHVYAMPEYDEGDTSVVPDELKVSLGFNVQAIPAEVGVVMNRTELSLDEGADATLRATTTDELASERLAWSSSNDDVVSVEDAGDGTAKVVAKKSGTAEVSASVTKDGKTYTATAKVTVSNENDRLYDMDENGLVTGYHGSSPDLVLPTNATGIADYAFSGLQVRSVTLNSGLKTIGSGAFQGDEQLTTLTIPAGSQLESIGDSAFEGAKVLTGDLTFPATFKDLGAAAFKDTVITGADLSQTAVTDIADDAFNGASSLASVRLPAGLKTIGAGSFATTASLTELELPEGLESIGDEAFNGGALLNFKAPSTLKSIGVTALGGLPLGKVELNEGLESIGDTAFSGVGATELSIPDSVTQIGANAFEDMSSLRKISLGGENPVPASPFVEDYALHTIEVRQGAKNLSSGSRGELMSADGATLVAFPLGSLDQGASYDVPASVQVIAPWAFYGASNLSGLNLASASNLTEIGDHAFMTSAVREFVVPAGSKLATIGDNAFYIDGKLEKVDLGSSVTSVGSFAFSENTALTSANLGSVQTLGDYAFAKSTALESFSYPDSLTSVGTSTIQNSGSIKAVSVGKNVPLLDSDTFVGLDSLERIDVAEGNAAMRSVDGVLYGVDEAGALTLTRYPSAKPDEAFEAPDGVVALADFSLSDNPHLKRASFRDGLASVGTSAFNGDSALEQLSLPDSVTQVGDVAFGSTALDTLTLGPNVASFDDILGPFSLASNLRHIVLEGGKDLAIPDNMSLDNLETLYLGPGVTSLSGGAFSDASKLKTVVVDTDLTAAPAGAMPAGAEVFVASGHDATADLLRGQGYNVRSFAPLSVTLTSSPVSAKPGERVTLAAQAAGGVGSNEYRFVSVAADGTETELQGWGTSAELKDFEVPESGSAVVKAYVRDATHVEAAGDTTVGAKLAAGTYAVPAQLLSADGASASPLDAPLADVAHLTVGDDGMATATLSFAAGSATGVSLVDAGRAAAPDDRFTVAVADPAKPTDVLVSTPYASDPVAARLVLDLGRAQASVNVADLKALLDQAARLNPTRYTEDTWAALVAARDAAQKAYDEVGTAQDAVNAAADKLRAAIEALAGANEAVWPGNGLYNVAISGKNKYVGNGRDMVGTSAQIEKDDTGTYLLLTLRPATVSDPMGTSAEMDASWVKQFLYYKGSDASTQYDAGAPVSTSEDGKTATYKLAIDDVAQTVTLKVWWKSGAPIAQPLDPILTLGTITPATQADADPDGQAALAEAYNRYVALDLSAYEADGQDAFKAALEATRTQLANPEATSDELAGAKAALEKAAAGLRARVDGAQLGVLVEQVKGYQERDYTRASWAPFKKALDAAGALASQGGDAEKVSAAYDALMRATLSLVRAADTSALSGAISKAEGLKLDEYADGAEKDEFSAALAAARELVGKDLAASDQKQVDDAAARLVKATAALKLKAADKAALQKAVDAAKRLDLGTFEDGAEKDAFAKALSDAEGVLADGRLTVRDQAKVDAAAKSLTDAQGKLRPKGTDGGNNGGSNGGAGNNSGSDDNNGSGGNNGSDNNGGAGNNGAGNNNGGANGGGANNTGTGNNATGNSNGDSGKAIPQTGDETNLAAPFGLGILGALAAALGIRFRRGRSR